MRFSLMVVALLSGIVVAQDMAMTPVDAADAARKVESYFNGLGTYQAAFAQKTSGEQWTQEGMFYLNRPKGQFLWNYETPDRQRLIATGTKLYFVDDEQGGAVTELPVKSGLSRLFTGQRLDLAREGLRVVKAAENSSHLTVLLTTNSGKDMGGLKDVTLEFTKQPMALVRAQVVDETDAVTQMAFTDVRQGIAMDTKMFKFVPRLKQM